MHIKAIKILWIAALLLCTAPAMSAETLDDIKGSWLGKMQIPNGPELRVGVEIFRKADSSWGGNIACLDQDTRYIPVGSVTLADNQLELNLAAAPISIIGTVNNDNSQISALFRQGDNSFSLPLVKVAHLPETARSQTPVDISGYKALDIVVENKRDKVWLAGTLTLPTGTDRAPAVLLIAGSGPNHRDSYFSGHRTFKVMADYLSKRGYAVLRMDKRGVYKSSGEFHTAEIKDFVDDNLAAIEFLKNSENIQANNIHVIGHSEGSLVASMLASQTELSSIISMGGPGMSIYDILVLQDQTEPAAKGAPENALPYLKSFSEKFYNTVLKEESEESRLKALNALYANLQGTEKEVVNKWVERTGTLAPEFAAQETFKTHLQDNPLTYWARVQLPVLVLNGAKDSQVSAIENVSGIYTAIGGEKYGSSQHIFPGLNHMFQTSKTGEVNDYALIEETISTNVLEVIEKWLVNFE
jgi:pimeloyl-ACP methyl ester carboxylesterase